ncbi:MAG: HGxxPAAW family protein [Micrococcaceae bacterium]|nr:HGxxPAAW family protein [Micrococcaceae bacterium]
MANANTQIDPMHADEVGHGNSRAAWTMYGIMITGVIIGAIAFAAHNPTIVYVGCAIVAVGLIVGWVMKKAGFGVNGPKSGFSH